MYDILFIKIKWFYYLVYYYPKNVKMNQIKILKIPFLGYIAILIWSSDRYFLPLPISSNMDLAKPAITWKILRLRQPWMCLIAHCTIDFSITLLCDVMHRPITRSTSVTLMTSFESLILSGIISHSHWSTSRISSLRSLAYTH